MDEARTAEALCTCSITFFSHLVIFCHLSMPYIPRHKPRYLGTYNHKHDKYWNLVMVNTVDTSACPITRPSAV